MGTKVTGRRASVTIEDDDGDRITIESDESGASVDVWYRVNGTNQRIVLDEAGRRAAIVALGGLVA